MKKIYKKPIIMVESYQLDVGIASCSGDGGIVIQYAEDNCYYNAGGMIYYANESCDFNPNEPNDFGDDYCYHGLNNGLGLPFFSS